MLHTPGTGTKTVHTITSMYAQLERVNADPYRPHGSGTELRARCPVHGGNNQNLAINERDGQILAFCHSRCQGGKAFWNDLLKALDGDPLPPADPAAKRRHRAGDGGDPGNLTATYYYAELGTGKELWRKQRYEKHENGKRLHKTFRWERYVDFNGGTWMSGLEAKTEIPLYNWNNINGSEQVIWVEGEKSVDALSLDKVAAVTTHAGAKGPIPENLDCLIGKEILIVADNDFNGHQYGSRVAHRLAAMNIRYRLAQPPKTGTDLDDHFDAGLTWEDLEFIKDKNGEYLGTQPHHYGENPDFTGTVLVAPERKKRIVFRTLRDSIMEHLTWVVPNLIPADALTLLTGREETGKSTWAGMVLADLSRKGAASIVLGTEDAWSSVWVPRLTAHAADVDLIRYDPHDELTDEEGEVTLDPWLITNPDALKELGEQLQEDGIKIVYIDHLGDMLSAGTRIADYGEMGEQLKALNRWAVKYHLSVIAGWHLKKSGGEGSLHDAQIGSTAIRSAPRCVLAVAEDRETNIRWLAVDKLNGGANKETLPAHPFSIVGATVEWNGDTYDTSIAVPSDVPQPPGAGWKHVEHLMQQNSKSSGSKDSETQQVADHIREVLTEAGGSCNAVDVEKSIRATFGNVYPTVIKNARDKINVTTQRRGFGKGGHWIWTLSP